MNQVTGMHRAGIEDTVGKFDATAMLAIANDNNAIMELIQTERERSIGLGGPETVQSGPSVN